MSDITRNAIATLREELQNERTRAEAAEAELRELRKAVDAWKAASIKMQGTSVLSDDWFSLSDATNKALEALRHA